MNTNRQLPHGSVVRRIPDVAMARSVVAAGTKVTDIYGEKVTLAQPWDGQSMRVRVNSLTKGLIEMHPSKLFIDGRSLQDIGAGRA